MGMQYIRNITTASILQPHTHIHTHTHKRTRIYTYINCNTELVIDLAFEI